MSRSAQRSNIYQFPTSKGDRCGSSSDKELFARNCMKYPDMHKSHLFQPPPQWGKVPKIFFARNLMKCIDLQRSHVCLPLHLRGGRSSCNSFARNCMKCSYLHRKVYLFQPSEGRVGKDLFFCGGQNILSNSSKKYLFCNLTTHPSPMVLECWK